MATPCSFSTNKAEMKKTTVYLGLGTNLGDKTANMRSAIHELDQEVGHIEKVSHMYATEPWGFESENEFLNAVCSMSTEMTAEELLKKTKEIELTLGRTAKTGKNGYADRIIDIDILLYGDDIIECDELVVPHPHMSRRLFVMEPLAEIAPDMKHPVTGESMKYLESKLKDKR